MLSLRDPYARTLDKPTTVWLNGSRWADYMGQRSWANAVSDRIAPAALVKRSRTGDVAADEVKPTKQCQRQRHRSSWLIRLRAGALRAERSSHAQVTDS